MTPDQIASWTAAGESETVEFKRTTGERCEATRTLCAMLNHLGERALFGVEAVGRVVGQQVVSPFVWPTLTFDWTNTKAEGAELVARNRARLAEESSAPLRFG